MKDSFACVESLPAPLATNYSLHEYSVYGIALKSELSLPLPSRTSGELSQIELRTASAFFFADAIEGVVLHHPEGSWYQWGRLEDRSWYARWDGVGEFLVSGDGGRIVCRQFDVATTESFHVYLLGQALSYALVMLGFEPLHATVVVVDGEGVGFLGASGSGKSSLAACFLDAGHRVLTDDLLLLREEAGRVLAYPGPSRIKLFPKQARKLIRRIEDVVRMNPDTEKFIVPLDKTQTASTPVPIRVLYTLTGPKEAFQRHRACFEPLSSRDAFLELTKNTFNRRILDVDRLERQLEATARLANVVPVRKLSYARVLGQLPSVRRAILSDLAGVKEVACAD